MGPGQGLSSLSIDPSLAKFGGWITVANVTLDLDLLVGLQNGRPKVNLGELHRLELGGGLILKSDASLTGRGEHAGPAGSRALCDCNRGPANGLMGC
jgi:hypothetical protein